MERESSKRHRCQWSRSAIALILATIGSCLLVSEQPACAAGVESYRLATGFYQRKKWELSVKEFRVFLKDQPKHPKAEKAEVYLGMALVNLQKFKEARTVFRAFVKAHLESRYLSHAMYRTGECSFLLNDLKSAEGELAQFLEKFPEDPLVPRARYNLAETKLALQKPGESTELFQQVVKSDSNSGLTTLSKFGLAKAYTQLKKFPEAELVYTELAKNLEGENAAEALMQLGDLHFDQGDYASSTAEYADIVKRVPDSPLVTEARLKTGMSLFGAGNYREAVAQLDPLIDDKRHGVEAEFWKGVSLKSAGDYAAAIEVLKTNYGRLGQSPDAPRTLYQWADSEQMGGRHEAARGRFLELVSKWPDHTLADDALHAAGLSALKAKKIEETEQLIARFAAEYPGSGLRIRQQLLKGRLNLTQGRGAEKEQAAKFYQSATKQFRGVMEQSKIKATKTRAGYFLAFSEYELGRYSEALAVITPVVEESVAAEQASDSTYVDAHVLQALCLLKLDQYKAAGLAASAYLNASPQGEFVAQALGIRARAAAKLGDKPGAATDQESLKADWPKTLDYARTTEELAEIAYDNDDFAWAATLYQQLAELDKQSKYRPVGLSGLGWARYQQKMYELAAEAFAKLAEEYPKHRLAVEAGFKHGDSLRKLGKIEEAATVFTRVFETYAPADKAFVAGLAAARQLRALKRIDEADKIYDSLVKRYPSRKDLVQLLNEWAIMHHNATNYEQADAISRKIIKDHADAPLADEARLNLAISDFINGKLVDARSQLRALVTKPELSQKIHEEAIYRLIVIEVGEKHWKEARAASEESLKLFPTGIRAWDARYHLAQADYELKEFDKAQPALLKLKESRQEPADAEANDQEIVGNLAWFPKVWIMLAEIELRKKNYAGVAQIVKEFTEDSPESPFLYQVEETLGRSLKAQAKFAEAREVFERVINSETGKQTYTAAKSQFLIAETYFHEKHYAKAVEEYDTLDILYNFPEWQSLALLGAGKCQELNENWKEAVEYYQDLLKKFPESPSAAEAKKRLAAAQQKASR